MRLRTYIVLCVIGNGFALLLYKAAHLRSWWAGFVLGAMMVAGYFGGYADGSRW